MNVTAVTIVAIICWAIVQLVNGGKKNKLDKNAEADITQLKGEVEKLQERVITLEKIVTDEKEELKRKIDSL